MFIETAAASDRRYKLLFLLAIACGLAFMAPPQVKGRRLNGPLAHGFVGDVQDAVVDPLGRAAIYVADQRQDQVFELFVGGEARAFGGELEEHSARLAKVDRLEPEAVDDRRRLEAAP